MHYALTMAQSFGATLTLVHIYDPAYSYAEAQEVIGTLERLCLQLKKEHAGSEFTVDVGVPYLRIPEIARNLQADLLVIAKHNYSGLERFVFGGDFERILQRTPCPVLVVDENDEDAAVECLHRESHGFWSDCKKNRLLYTPHDRRVGKKGQSRTFFDGRNAGDLIAVNLLLGLGGFKNQTTVVKCVSAKRLRLMKMKKIEAIARLMET